MQGEPVFLNIYDLITQKAKSADLSKDALDVIGMGVFHSGLEIFGEEISFGMDPTGRNDPKTDGVFTVRPKTAMGKFKEQIELGRIQKNKAQAQEVLNTIRPNWRAASYHMLGHNCNCFTKAFCEALNPQLLEKYPNWLNRAANTGDVVVPSALLKSITDAVAPPTAGAPDLINKIHIPHQGAAPKPLPPQGQPVKKEAPASGGMGGFLGKASAMASAATSAVSSAVGDGDKKEFSAAFPSVPAAELVDKFKVDILHINRTQSATLYVCKKSLCFSGANQLNLVMPLSKVVSLQYAITVPDAQANVPPTFNPTSDVKKSDALLVFLQGNVMIPLFNPGSLLGKATGLVGTSPAQKLMVCIDDEWRNNVNL